MRAHGLVYTLGILVFVLAYRCRAVSRSPALASTSAGGSSSSPRPSSRSLRPASSSSHSHSPGSLTSASRSPAQVDPSPSRKATPAASLPGCSPPLSPRHALRPSWGAAIGYALAQSAVVTFAVFTALALGLATPYLLLTLQPSWTKLLPRPGAWMETLKHLTAVPLFATVIWLTWVYGRLHITGENGAESDAIGYLLLCFLLVAVAGWALHKWPARWSSTVAAVGLIAGGLAIPALASEDCVWSPAPPSTVRCSHQGI